MPLPDQKLLAALMGSTPDRIFFKDKDGRFISVSDATVKNLGMTHEEQVIGKTDFDFFNPIHASQAREDELKVMETGQPMVGKIEREVLANGRLSWVQTTKVALRDDSGKSVGICGISRDVTDSYNNEQQVRKYAAELAEKQAQMDRELALAREIQHALILGDSPINSEWNFTHRYLPSGSVGGDFFSIIPINDQEIGLLICDVTGHGVHAALITVAQRLLVDELHRKWSDPSEFLEEMNNRLCQLFSVVSHPYFVTACYAVLNASKRTIRFGNAGHPLPLLVNRKESTVMELEPKSTVKHFALGIGPGSKYQNEDVSLHSGDQLIFYTDGLVDVEMDENDPKLTKAAFHKLIKNNLTLEPDLFLDGVIKSIREFSADNNFFDDVCLVGAELK